MSDPRTSGPVYGPVARRYGEPPAPDYAAITAGTPVPVRRGTEPARWGRRLPAYLIDFAPVILACIPMAIAYVLALIELSRGPVGSALLWAGIGLILMLAALGWTIYNRWLIGGHTGQSLGKRVLRLDLVSGQTGEPIGPLNAFVRDIVHILDLVTVVGFLWPLWDGRRETFADMIIQTVVIDARVPTGNGLDQGRAS